MTEARPSTEQPPAVAPDVNVVRLSAEPPPKRSPAAFWRRQRPLLVATAASLAWGAAVYYLGWSDPAAIVTPLLLPWLVAAVYLLATPNRHARIDVASGLDHSLRPVEAAEARIMALTAKLDKRMETIAAVGGVAGDRFENMARSFERQMNDIFSAATAVEKIATKVDAQLRESVNSLSGVKDAFTQDSDALTTRLMTLVEALHQATADGNRLSGLLTSLDRSISAISATLKGDAEEIAGLGQAAEKTIAVPLRHLNEAIFEVRESLAASDQQLAATRKVYEAVLQDMTAAQASTRLRQRKEGTQAAP